MSTVNDFRETPYADAKWEIVSEIEDSQHFVPLKLDKVATEHDSFSDPMFPNYGGTTEGKKLWHLPTDQAAIEESEKEVAGPPKITMTEEEFQLAIAEAEARGEERGLSEATAKNQQMLMEAHQSIQTVLQDLSSQNEERIQVIERNAIQLSLKIAKKLLTAAVEFNPEYIVHIVKEAIDQAKTAVIQEVRVSPQDLEFIKILGIESMKEFEGIPFVADETIRAGCIANTTAGEIDYNLDSAFARIEEKVVLVTK